MKITIYELLGLIKDGKAPKKIKYQNYKWVWTGDDYKTIKGVKECFLITGQEYTWVTEFLNDEVEIIEEKPKHIERIDDDDFREKNTMNEIFILYRKQEEIRQAVNYLLDKEEE